MVKRIKLSGHARVLQLSLLASLGLLPGACGGSSVTSPDGFYDPAPGGSSAVSQTPASGADAPTNGSTQSTAGGIGVTFDGTGGTAGSTAISSGGASIITTGGSAGAHGIAQCESPTLDPVTHLITCGNGFSHRETATKCALPSDASGAAGSAGDSGAAGETGSTTAQVPCQTDADCSSVKLGFCPHPNYPAPPSFCFSGCLQDSDCGPQALCQCDGSAHGGKCTTATCRTDAECGAGSLCASANDSCVDRGAFACLSTQDECVNDDDCFDRGVVRDMPGKCFIQGEPAHRACVFNGCGP